MKLTLTRALIGPQTEYTLTIERSLNPKDQFIQDLVADLEEAVDLAERRAEDG